MSREEYESLLWRVSDEEWEQIQQAGLVPDRDSEDAWSKFEELMKRTEKKGSQYMYFDYYEQFFLGKMDLIRFCKKFPGDAECYMQELS